MLAIANRIGEALQGAGYQLAEMSERNHGVPPVATEATNGKNASARCGRFGAVEQLLEDLLERAQRLEVAARFLNNTH